MYYILTVFIILMIILIIWVTLLCNTKIFKNTNIDESITNIFYWINLDKAITRNNNMKNLFKKYNINNIRIPAIQGGPLEKDKAVACTSSHVKAIKTFYDTGDDIGIICEDDLTMEYHKYWRNSLNTVIKKAPEDWEVIQLAVIMSSYIKNKLLFSYQKLYIPYQCRAASTLIYIINKKGATKIIKNNNPPSDWAEDFIYNQCITYIYKYPMFTYPDDNDSDIHPDHIPDHVYSKMLITNYLKYQ
jgi:GR25 family glycosyltransferase involved in LPS biosynthesis